MGKSKKGVSLVMLAITIIVIVIITGTTLVSLNDNGMIDKSNNAVYKTNLNQVQDIANMAWTEARANKAIKTDEQYKEYVENKLKEYDINADDYNIVIDKDGVTITVDD